MTELPGYLHRRQFDAIRDYRQTEQTYIGREIAGPVADVGVTIATDPGPGFLRDRSYTYLEGESRAELLTNLTEVISGPEFRPEYTIDPGTTRPGCTLRIAYPRVGTAASGLGLTVPGQAVGYTGTWDDEQYRTRTFAVGDLPEDAPEGATQPVVIVDRPQPGVPRLDKVDNWPSVILISTLTERANTNATVYTRPTFDVTGSVFASDPPLGSYGLGDDVTVHIRDPLLPAGLDTPGRLVGIGVDAVTDEVTWTVSLTQPPAKPRASLSTRLAGLAGDTRAVFHRRLGEPT